MNKCFNDFPQYKNRKYVSSYSRRTRAGRSCAAPAERILSICAGIASAFEASAVQIIGRIAALVALFVGLFFLIAAIGAGSIGVWHAVLIMLGLAAGLAAVLRI